MGKLLSSALKLNIQEGLLSISSAWEPVKGEARGAPQEGLVGHAFPRGVRDTEGLSLEGGGGRQEPAAIFVLFLQSPGSHLAKGRLSPGLSETTIHLHKSQDRWRGEGMRGPGP